MGAQLVPGHLLHKVVLPDDHHLHEIEVGPEQHEREQQLAHVVPDTWRHAAEQDRRRQRQHGGARA